MELGKPWDEQGVLSLTGALGSPCQGGFRAVGMSLSWAGGSGEAPGGAGQGFHNLWCSLGACVQLLSWNPMLPTIPYPGAWWMTAGSEGLSFVSHRVIVATSHRGFWSKELLLEVSFMNSVLTRNGTEN